jgi:hypothetical protein
VEAEARAAVAAVAEATRVEAAAIASQLERYLFSDVERVGNSPALFS